MMTTYADDCIRDSLSALDRSSWSMQMATAAASTDFSSGGAIAILTEETSSAP